MKFTLSWLKEHLETEASVREITDKLTAIGLELEGLHDPREIMKPFKIAYVVSAEQHPDADKLRVCMVNTGDDGPLVQVVCGAPNARTGMKGVFAPNGSFIPGTELKLKAGKIRRQESNGMLLSERELGLSDEHDGIIDLADDAPLGMPFADYIGMNDPVIEIGLTPDRGDCAGVRGIARDLAATGIGSLKPNRASFDAAGQGQTQPAVYLDAGPELTPVFVYRLIRNVKNGPSPLWLQHKLTAIGQKPISALVDVTNWMTMDQCRPMHVFDADKLQGDLRVRLAEQGESMLALNGKTYNFDQDMLVIADDSGPVSLAGITGGENTGCADDTVNVLVEAALWSPSSVARTGRKLDLHTDARFRFERGTDFAAVLEGMNIATQYILDFCGGEPAKIAISGTVSEATQTQTFRPERIESLTGFAVETPKAMKILHDLGFKPKRMEGAVPCMRVPSWRSDIQGEADLVEEVVRIIGFDSIPAVSLPRDEAVPDLAFSPLEQSKRRARRALAAAGLQEAVTWSFMSDQVAKHFAPENPLLFLENPMSSELNYMRPSLLPNLLAALGRNQDRGFADLGLFEVGTVFQGLKADEQPKQAAAVRAGKTLERHWGRPARAVDLFDAKQDAETALREAGAPTNLQVRQEAPVYYHPGRSGSLCLGKNTLAYFGEVHPVILKALDVKGPIVGMELFFDAIPTSRKKSGFSRPLLKTSPFQASERDFAFIVDEQTAAETLLKAIKGADKKLITQVNLFDVYRGKGVEEGKKSLAIAVRMQSDQASLTEEEIEAVAGKIVAAAAKSTGATLRD